MSKYLSIYFLVIVLIAMIACENTDKSTKKLSTKEKTTYIEEGKQIAKTTAATLSARLKQKVKEGGIQGAIGYCNVNAYTLTDSISKVNNVIIRRVSENVRNLANRPDTIESNVIAEYEKQIKAKSALKPTVVEVDGKARFMAPIVLQPMCLNCHGTPVKHINKNDLANIRELYPDDEAINYKAGDLRGIWSITFLE
jgi:hypothetical protein